MKQNAIILKGRKGEKIFSKIYNGPKLPYERLEQESEEIKEQWKAEENSSWIHL